MAGKPRKHKVFKNRWFVRFARREGIEDAALCAAIRKVEKGLIDADLGGGVIKRRMVVVRATAGGSGATPVPMIGCRFVRELTPEECDTLGLRASSQDLDFVVF